jgi:hypothetical protein
MISNFTHENFRFVLFTRDLVVSAAGSFLFMPGFRLVTAGNDGAGTLLSVHKAHASTKPLKGAGAAFFLMSFMASEALATMRAFSHRFLFVAKEGIVAPTLKVRST